MTNEEEETIGEILFKASKGKGAEEIYVTVKQCSNFLQMTPIAIINLVDENNIEAIRLGPKSIRIKLSSLMAYLARSKYEDNVNTVMRRDGKKKKKKQGDVAKYSGIKEANWEMIDSEIGHE